MISLHIRMLDSGPKCATCIFWSIFFLMATGMTTCNPLYRIPSLTVSSSRNVQYVETLGGTWLFHSGQPMETTLVNSTRSVSFNLCRLTSVSVLEVIPSLAHSSWSMLSLKTSQLVCLESLVTGRVARDRVSARWSDAAHIYVIALQSH